jgi:hypothetical protein
MIADDHVCYRDRVGGMLRAILRRPRPHVGRRRPG